jgi:DNA-directed RNA polymerase specialized sigma24 family protein
MNSRSDADALSTAPANGQSGFQSTAWSLVLAAAQDVEGRDALDRLCRRYWRPAYTYARRTGLTRCDAEDATQAFFSFLLAREWLKQAHPERGGFRAFLLTLLRNFLLNRWRHDHAQKRGGAATVLSLDADVCERELAALPDTGFDPVQAYERTWANCVIQVALERLASENDQPDKGVPFAKLRPFLVHSPGPGDYEQLSETLGLPRARVAVMIHRYSRRFAELIRSEVADTLVDRTQLEVELRGLRDAITR